MNKLQPLHLTILLGILFTVSTYSGAPTLTIVHENGKTHRCTIAFSLEPNDCILLDTIDISIDNPQATIASWQAIEPIQRFLPEFKETKRVLADQCRIEVMANIDHTMTNPRLHVRYYERKTQQMVEQIFPLQAAVKPEPNVTPNTPTASVQSSTTAETSATAPTWIESLTTWFKNTDSTAIRIILAFFLGLLLSLTPCIYPMIPITIGILQAQAQPSILGNIARATAYTVGIATTFSALGLLAACTGQLFGSIMNNPFVILTIVALLLYLAGSMIGWYELYTPPFMQNRSAAQGGSLASAFMFGALSGTIASPCLSPGLVLLLTIVTQLKSILLGFTLLFSFGIGLSTPLMIIGTFSSSLQVLPRAGSWMVDIKQLVGFMMIGICFYFLNNLLPFHLTITLIGLFIMFMGIFYLNQGNKTTHSWTRTIKNSSGTLLVAASILFLAKGYQLKNTESPAIVCFWQSDYLACLATAKKEHKKLLLDISAPYCTICKAIDKKFFMNEAVTCALSNTIIPVKIDELDTNNPVHKAIQERYGILGVPTLLLIDPADEKQLTCWGSELYDCEPEVFVGDIQQRVGM